METDPIQTISTDTVTSPLANLLSRPQILSTASSILQAYPSFTSAYLFGSYAKGTARPGDSDIDIAVFLSLKERKKPPNWIDELGGAHMDLEEAFGGTKVDLSVCPHGDFLERIRSYWVPIDIGPRTCDSQQSIPDTIPAAEKPSDVIKDRLHGMTKIGTSLLEHIVAHHHQKVPVGVRVNFSGNESLLEHAHIRYCIDILGVKVKRETLGFDPHVQEYWSALRTIATTTAAATRQDDEKVDLADEIWIPDLLKETKALLAVIEEKLAAIDSENA